MTLKEDMLYDFSFNVPRVLICGSVAIVDNVRHIVSFSREKIVVYNGEKYTSVEGKNLEIRELNEERMTISGEVEQVYFLVGL